MVRDVQLGPFELERQIGAGGMGVVYRARHVDTGERVAVKALLSDVARRPEKRRDFRREVQALARLHHPSVSAVVDYGKIDEDSARHGPAPFVQDAPWYAMEYVDGDSAPKRPDAWTWPELESTLHRILDGLAHAHARSIVHRDLKPENILLHDDESEASGVTVVDFGIARLFGTSSGETQLSSQRVTGTPKYMAPEQIRGIWRDEGAWTDLYALGCLTWRIVSGAPPFDGPTADDILRGHLEEPLPAFEPALPVPEGLENWLEGLLDKDVETRTRRAADAASGLLHLGDPVEEAGARSDDPPSERFGKPTAREQPTLRGLTDTVSETGAPTRAHTQAPTRGDTQFGETEPEPEQSPPSDRAPTASAPAVLPDWRRGNEDRSAAPRPRAGLELFALRDIPVVDRVRTRDRMWRALREVRNHDSARLVLLEGGPGTGKSRLARWLAYRAHETGAANVLTADHDATSGPDEGLRDLIRRRFRTTGLSRDEVFERLAKRLPAGRANRQTRLADAAALTELTRPTEDDADSVAGPPFRFSSADQKFAPLRRLVENLSVERPTVVWVDDLQWGGRTLDFLEYFFESSLQPPPALVLATVRSDVVAEQADKERRIDDIRDAAVDERIQLEPLGPEDHRELIDRLLHLEPQLADRLAERTEGNPLFAIQLLRDWVGRDLLRHGRQGFRLDTNDIDVPETIHRLWSERIESVLGSGSWDDEAARLAVERSAALGREIHRRMWRHVAEKSGLDATDELPDELVDRGLAEPTDSGWAFTHGLLVDSIRRLARHQDRWTDHHAFCAERLADLDDEGRDLAERRARHWLEAESPEQALAPMLEAAENAHQSADYRRARAYFTKRRNILDALDAPADDPRRVENEVGLAKCKSILDGDPESAADMLRDTRQRAERLDDSLLLAKTWEAEASFCESLGEYDRARDYAERAVEHARESDDESMLAAALFQYGWLEMAGGEIDVAERNFSESRRVAEEAEDRYQAVIARRGLGWTALSRGDEARARDIFEELLEDARDAGFRSIESSSLNALGELARYDEDVPEARRRYQQYQQCARENYEPESIAMAHLNLAQVELLDRDFNAVLEHLHEAEQRMIEHSRENQRPHGFRLARLAHAAGIAHWAEFDELFAPYADGWPDDSSLFKDDAWLMELAGDCAAESGDDERARNVWRVARDLWKELGDDEAAADLEHRMASGN